MESDQQDVSSRHEGLIPSEAAPSSPEWERLSEGDRGFLEQPQHLKNAFPSDKSGATPEPRARARAVGAKQSGCVSARAFRAPLVMELSGAPSLSPELIDGCGLEVINPGVSRTSVHARQRLLFNC